MTRRDIAAMRLALECLRADEWDAAVRALDFGTAAIDQLTADANEAPVWVRWAMARARLALYLRAALRAEAGDCGPMVDAWECVDCSRVYTAAAMVCTAYACNGEVYRFEIPVRQRFVPLWERAPATRTP